jgi:ribosomal-protein-alanine N-acetyltransferase
VTLEESFKHPPTFVTDRLLIRPIEDDDAGAIFEFKSDPDVTVPYGQEPKSLEETQRWVKNRINGYRKHESVYWVITLKPESKVIGSCCFWNFDLDFSCAELGYELHREHQGKGIMTEAITPVLAYGFKEMGFHRIEACPYSNNEPSRKLLIKLGFKYEGNLRQRHKFRGTYLDQHYYAVLHDEWKASRK